MPDISPITTNRLSLRRPQSDDLGDIVQLANCYDVARTLSRLPHPYTDDDAHYFLNNVVPNEHVWTIRNRLNDQLMGIIGVTPNKAELTKLNPVPAKAELGYWLGKPFWGYGYATEAGLAIMKYTIQILQYDRVTACCFEDNPASMKVLTKIGFKEVRRSASHCLATGCERPVIEALYTPLNETRSRKDPQ